jgi:hypothetical protein
MNIVIDEVERFGFKMRATSGQFSYKSDNTEDNRRTTQKGNCVRDNLELYKKLNKLNPKFIQGECVSRLGDWATADEGKGMPTFHAWVEIGDKVYDYSNGQKLVGDRELFYLLRRVKRTIESVPTFNLTTTTQMGKNRIITISDIGFDEAEEAKRQVFYKSIRDKQKKLGYNSGW